MYLRLRHVLSQHFTHSKNHRFYTFISIAWLVKYISRTELFLVSKFSVRIRDFINVYANIWKIIDLKQTLKDCVQCLIFMFFVLIYSLKTYGLVAKNNLQHLPNNLKKLIGISILYTSQASPSKKCGDFKLRLSEMAGNERYPRLKFGRFQL